MAGVRFNLDTSQFDAGAKKIIRDLDRMGSGSLKTEAKIKKLDAEIKKLATGMNKSEKEVKQLTAKNKQLGASVDRLTAKNKQLAASHTAAAQATAKSRKGLVTFVRTVASTAATLMILDRAIQEVQAAMSVGIEFEQRIAEVRAIARATVQEFGAIAKAARKAGTETIWSASEAADALRFLARAGFTVTEAITALPDTLAIAQIGELELGRATDIVSDSLRAFNLDVDQLTRVVDVFTGTITRTNTDVEMMADAMKFAAPIAAQLGYTIEETSAMIGNLSQSGIKAGIAGRGMQMAFIKTAGAAKRLGLSVDSDLIDVLRELNVQQISVNEISEMFGVRALKSVLVLKSNVDQYEKLEKTLKNVNGESKRYVDGLLTVDVAVKKFVSIIKESLIGVFNEYRDTLWNNLVNATAWIKDHKDSIISTSKAMVTFAKYAGKLAGAFLLWKGTMKLLNWELALFQTHMVRVAYMAKMGISLKAAGVSAGFFAAGIRSIGAALASIPFVGLALLAAWGTKEALNVFIKYDEDKQARERIQGEIDQMSNLTVPVFIQLLRKNPRFYDEQIVKLQNFVAEQKSIIAKADKELNAAMGIDTFFGFEEEDKSTPKIKAANAELKRLEGLLAKIKIAQDVLSGAFEKDTKDFWQFKKAEAGAEAARLLRITQTEELRTRIVKTAGGKRWDYENQMRTKAMEQIEDLPRAEMEIQKVSIDQTVAAEMKKYDTKVKTLAGIAGEVEKAMAKEAAIGEKAWEAYLNGEEKTQKARNKIYEKYNAELRELEIGESEAKIEAYAKDLEIFGQELQKRKDLTEEQVKEIKQMMIISFTIDLEGKDLKKIRKKIKDLEKLSDIFEDALGDVSSEYRDSMLAVIDEQAKLNEKLYGDEVDWAEWAKNKKLDFEQEFFEAKTAYITEGLGQLESAFSSIASIYAEGSEGAERWTQAAKAMEIAQRAVAVVDAVIAVLNQASGDPYTAFGRMATMAATVGALLASIGEGIGGSVGGSASAEAALPASTVLGAEAGTGSSSMANSWEFLQDTYDMQYRELSGIYNEMKKLNSNIKGLVTSIFRTGGIDTSGIQVGEYLGSVQGVFNDFVSATSLGLTDIFNDLTFGISGWIDDTVSSLVGSIFGGGGYTNITGSGISTGAGSVGGLSGGVGIGGQQYTDVHTHEEGGWFSSDSDSYYTAYKALDENVSRLLDMVFQNMSSTLVDLTLSLGTDMNETLNYVFAGAKINLSGLSSEDVNKTLTEHFSALGDNAVDALFGELIGAYQQLGEGMLETATRIVIDKAIVLDTLKMTEQSIGSYALILQKSRQVVTDEWKAWADDDSWKDAYAAYNFTDEVLDYLLALNPALRGAAPAQYETEYYDEIASDTASMIAFSEAIIEMAGGLDILREASETYYDKFFTEQEAQFRLVGQLAGAMGDLNLAFPLTREGYRDMLEGLDLSTEAGQRAYVGMLKMAESADAFYSYIEDLKGGFMELRERIIGPTDTFDSLMAEYDTLDEDSATYYVDSLDLLTRMTDAAEGSLELQQQELDSLNSQITSIDDMIMRLTGGDLAPVQSEEWFTGRYQDLLGGVTTQEGVDELLGFIPEYLGFMNAYGSDMASLNASIISDISGIKDDLVDRQVALLEEIAENTNNTLLTDVLTRLDEQLAALTLRLEEAVIVPIGGTIPDEVAGLLNPESTVLPSTETEMANYLGSWGIEGGGAGGEDIGVGSWEERDPYGNLSQETKDWADALALKTAFDARVDEINPMTGGWQGFLQGMADILGFAVSPLTGALRQAVMFGLDYSTAQTALDELGELYGGIPDTGLYGDALIAEITGVPVATAPTLETMYPDLFTGDTFNGGEDSGYADVGVDMTGGMPSGGYNGTGASNGGNGSGFSGDTAGGEDDGWGRKYGGLISGPESGYYAKLHGTEVVVSQKGGGIPVEMGFGGYIGSSMDLNNPTNGNFMKSLGIDPEAIGTAIAERLSGDTHVHVEIDGNEIGHVVVSQLKTNPELIEQTRGIM